MELNEFIEKLKSYSPKGFPFVSQYVNAHWEEQFHKNRTKLFFKNEWNAVIARFRKQDAPNEVMRSLQQDREKIENYLADQMHGTIDRQYRGLAFFASGGSGFFEIFRSHVEFDDQLVVHSEPHLRQLAALVDAYETMLLVMVDSGKARVYELRLAGVDERVNIIDEIPNYHKVGGWSQRRFQRHVEEHRDLHHKEVARVVERMVDEQRLKNIVIAGQNDVIAEFSRFLPKRVLDKVFVTIHLDILEPENVVIRKVIEHLQRHDRAKESQGVQDAVKQAAIGGKGAVGLLATLRAVNERGVRILYISRNFKPKGIRCTSCRQLSGLASRCPYCSQSVEEIDLAEEMANDVIEAGGRVDRVEASKLLDSYEGVAAATRFEKTAVA